MYTVSIYHAAVHVRALAPSIPPLALAVVVAACGPESVTTDGTTSTSDSQSSSNSAPTSTTADALATTGVPDGEGFGFACIELVQAESQDTDPFVGTAAIKVTLKYEPCLIDYYTTGHPEQRLDGVEGPKTFIAWMGRLCTEPVNDPLVACEIEGLSAFEQVIVDDGPGSVYQMTITYKVTDPARIINRTLLWGPAPLESIAECAMGQRPYVRMTLQSDIVGLDEHGTLLWNASSFANQSVLPQLGSAGCIQADISRVP